MPFLPPRVKGDKGRLSYIKFSFQGRSFPLLLLLYLKEVFKMVDLSLDTIQELFFEQIKNLCVKDGNNR